MDTNQSLVAAVKELRQKNENITVREAKLLDMFEQEIVGNVSSVTIQSVHEVLSILTKYDCQKTTRG
jgi:hypothetical protein